MACRGVKSSTNLEQFKPYGFQPTVSEVSGSKRMETEQDQQLVSQRMELESKGIGEVAMTGKPIGAKVAFDLLDAVLTLSAVVIAVKDLFGCAWAVGDDKAPIAPQRTHFDLDHDSSSFFPASGPVLKGIKDSDKLVSAGVLALSFAEPALGFSLKHRVGSDADGIEHAQRFQRRIDFGASRAGIGPVTDLSFGEALLKDGKKTLKLIGEPGPARGVAGAKLG